MERQRVSPCLQVFCDNTLSSLKSHPELQNKDGRMIFLSKIIEFWKIVNVHGPYRDVRWRDADRAAIYSAEDINLQKLSEFSDFVEQYLTPPSSKIRVKFFYKRHILQYHSYLQGICRTCSMIYNTRERRTATRFAIHANAEQLLDLQYTRTQNSY